MTNEWILYTDYLEEARKWNTEKYFFWNQSGVKLEFMQDGEIVKRKNGGHLITQLHIDNDRAWAEARGRDREYSDDDLGKIMVYVEDSEEGHWDHIDASTYYVRMNQKQFDKYIKLKELIQVGDFVCFSGSKGYPWRQVLEIKGNTIYGRCSRKPEESGLVFHSSDNGILTAMEVIRNGEKIF